MTLKKYIKTRSSIPKRETYWNSVVIIQKDNFPKGINIENIILQLKRRIPQHLTRGIDAIYIGDFEHLRDRNLDAAYETRAIYLLNNKENEEDVIDDIVHELAHSLEEMYGLEIYGDGLLQQEFLSRRQKMFLRLADEGFNVELSDFLNVEYNKIFDFFLYQEIGYAALFNITSDLFYSPYGSTSLREYWANGFEAFYYHRDVDKLKKISPILLEKCKLLLYNEEYEDEKIY